MQSSVSPKVAAAIVVVIVLIVGLVAYRYLFPNTSASPNSPAAMQEYNDIHAKSVIHQNQQGGNGHGMYGHTKS
ncbi:MAG TPA: hypothetical protein VKT32_12265 [Chthonomonadaceae bacterium]|nr:hypothetical protein [Chthonomonadaceae bacterium]